MSSFNLGSRAQTADARRHVNRLCVSAGVPLIESGTQGYLGQVTPMQKVGYDGVTSKTFTMLKYT